MKRSSFIKLLLAAPFISKINKPKKIAGEKVIFEISDLPEMKAQDEVEITGKEFDLDSYDFDCHPELTRSFYEGKKYVTEKYDYENGTWHKI